MGGSRLNVHLYRDSFNTPWGFRLQGGKDLSQPLVVQRVFSNSPAEGELQRGDVILSINSRDAGQLTHKQAQDLIKHGGGQVQLIVSRPPPGTHVAPLSPPIQQPRAPSLQDVRYLPPHSSRPTQSPMYQSADHRPAAQYSSPMYVTIQDRRRSTHSQPPVTPTTPPPPWAVQQAAPKRVSKLSQLGGGSGGFSFGTDYATLPRSRPGAAKAQYGATRRTPREADMQDASAEPVEPDRLATGPVPKVCNLRNLGGGDLSFGSDYGTSTLPRRNQPRRFSQPPPSMSGASGYGHMPTKLTLNRLGGGGPEFGSVYSPRIGQTPAQRVQSSLDNITLSPRTPEAPQGAPFYQPQWEPQQPQHPPPEQMYTPTGLLLEQQRLQQEQQLAQQQHQQPEEGEEEILPVWERRKQFLQPGDPSVRTPLHQPPPRVLRPKPGAGGYTEFGTDYSKIQQKPSTAQWTPAQPAPQFKPTPAPVSVQMTPYSPVKPSAPVPAPRPVKVENANRAAAPEWHPPVHEDDGVPAWRSTLRSSSGVKPWERDVAFTQEQAAARSVPFSPVSPPAPAPHGGAVSGGPQQGGDGGPKVVHLQYNSPMGLYSNQNVAETLHGQTQAIAGQTKPSQSQGGDDRDWSQSSVLRFIEQQNRREVKKPPATAPKPQYHQVQQAAPQQQPYYDEIGASDF